MTTPSEWQPIETAPRDGTKIFIWRDGWDFAPIAHWSIVDWNDDVTAVCVWLFDRDLNLGEAGDSIGWNEDIEDGNMPTHWMPLPAAPDSSTVKPAADDGQELLREANSLIGRLREIVRKWAPCDRKELDEEYLLPIDVLLTRINAYLEKETPNE